MERHRRAIWWNLLYVHPGLVGVGMIVDASTGAQFHLEPKSIDVKLSPAVAGVATSGSLTAGVRR
jgi:hypothetical protein